MRTIAIIYHLTKVGRIIDLAENQIKSMYLDGQYGTNKQSRAG